jgi:hypothetical protein
MQTVRSLRLAGNVTPGDIPATLAQPRISILSPISVYAIPAYATEMIEIDPQLERIVREDIPDDQAHVVGASIAPSGRYAVVMLIAGEGPAAEFDETVAERIGERWVCLQSGTPSSIIYAGDHRGAPLCNYMEPLPSAVKRVVVLDRGTEYEVPVEDGYFLYVAWKQDTEGDNRSDPPTPRVVRTVPASPLG